MELQNEIQAREPLEEGVRPEVRKEVLELLTLMLAPMTPHLAEELWEMLGHSEGLWTVGWPVFDAKLARDEEVEVVVQVNGRVRGKLKVAAGLGEAGAGAQGAGGTGGRTSYQRETSGEVDRGAGQTREFGGGRKTSG